MATKLYAELADWWPLLSQPEDYAEEATFFIDHLPFATLPAAPTLLELGSGGGSNALYMKRQFAHTTLSDISPPMLAVSQALNPDCRHVVGDMRTLRLHQEFDVVFVHDAIEYMTSESDLRLAIATAAIHCARHGVIMLVPDYVRETLVLDSSSGGHDGPQRGLRYLDWSYDPDPTDTTYVTEYVYMLREGCQPATVEYDRHLMGVFPRATWLSLLAEQGLAAEIVVDPWSRELFIARRST